MPVIWGVVGLAVGVILNALILWLPVGNGALRRLICCERCYAPLPVIHISALSRFLVNNGRCSHCGHKSSVERVVVELVTAALFAALCLRFGFSWPLIVYSLYVGVFLLIFVIDLKHRLIPNVVTYPSIALALALSFVMPSLTDGQALLGGVFYGGLFMGLYGVAFVLYKRTVALGLGDVKLAFLIGLITGLRGAMVALLLGTLLGAAVGLWLMLRGQSAKATMPYAPPLVVGAVATILWSPWIA